MKVKAAGKEGIRISRAEGEGRWMLDAGRWMLDAGCWVQGRGLKAETESGIIYSPFEGG